MVPVCGSGSAVLSRFFYPIKRLRFYQVDEQSCCEIIAVQLQITSGQVMLVFGFRKVE
jgi:hypothetical protein